MNTLDINFVRRRRFSSLAGLLLLAVGMLAVGVVGVDYLDAREELTRVELGLSKSQKPAVRPLRRENTGTAVADEKQSVERVNAQLNLPWDEVLREIAIRTGPSVALLDMEAQGQTRTLRLTGEAKTMSDVVAFVGRLRESPLIEVANLSRHEQAQAASVSVIRFSLDAVWRSPS